MYIPTWLLVAVVVVALLAFWRAQQRRVRGVEGDVAADRQIQHALVEAPVAVPDDSDPTAVMKSRLAYAASIKLGERLLQFYGDIRHMPNWYAKSLPYGDSSEPWSSDVIAREAIARVKMRDLTAYGIEIKDYEADHEATVLKFTAAKKGYVFCAHDTATPSWVGDVEDEPSYMFRAVKVYVVELPSLCVLEDEIVYKNDGYVDVYSSNDIESLRLGEWLTPLMKIGDDVRAESEAHYAAFSKRFEAKRAKKFS